MEQNPETDDANFKRQVQKMHQITVYTRWLVIGILWVTIAPLSLWALRAEIALWQDHFTWSAVRYGLAYNRLAAMGLGLCIGTTTATLVWHSRNILFGVSSAYQKRLEQQVFKILKQGKTHPFWKWVTSTRD
ncbi:hypothetical protein [Planktothrix paucivesiculata]|uniref:Uncharacterized protein n=1 Tax=Planktothrix paucivesiculata PCC 9631 TaxID=671071 RepID=A0A7Z9BUF7_9CYAN|nr:hypothetical protein [Planktothrix paucivesiculata]VXD21633.1 conserved hypothetical protein [Planktothrix paucivesiculata PCC 9631]